MTEFSRTMGLLDEQEEIRAKCIHSSGNFVEFPMEDVETSIPERFEKIVRMYPDQIAVKTDNYAVTYAELNTMANRVAHAIAAERADISEPIGIVLEKGVEQIAAMLGVLKAGKFFVLLDPSVTAERMLQILLLQSQGAGPEVIGEAVANLESLTDEQAERLLAQGSPKEI